MLEKIEHRINDTEKIKTKEEIRMKSEKGNIRSEKKKTGIEAGYCAEELLEE